MDIIANLFCMVVGGWILWWLCRRLPSPGRLDLAQYIDHFCEHARPPIAVCTSFRSDRRNAESSSCQPGIP